MKKYYITVDTEASNTYRDNIVTGRSAYVYDIGWIVADNGGNILVRRSFLVQETFIQDMTRTMSTAYFADKIPLYLEKAAKGKIKIKPFFEIREIFLQDFKKYSCSAVIAYNALFDYDALNNTARYLSEGKIEYFTPYNIPWECSLKMARSVLRNYKTYKMWCKDNGYMTAHKTPQPQMKAEIVYRYITHDNTFIEEHTALSDVLAEYEIYLFCKRSHKKLVRGLWEKLPPKTEKKK